VTRALALVLGGLLLAGAAPRQAQPLSLPLPPPLPLPLPPPLPVDPPTDLAAPVPDAGLYSPDGLSQDQSTALALRIYRMQEFGTGDAYVPGSEYQSPEDRRPMQPPGFLVTVPLR
jgi:hypothetical protein